MLNFYEAAGAVLAGGLLLVAGYVARSGGPERPLWQGRGYAVFGDRVEQGPHVGQAVSRHELTSGYRSPANERQVPRVAFKFSLNGADNELPPGQDHLALVLPATPGATVETPLLTFGQRWVDPRPLPAQQYLPPNTRLRLRVDLRPVLAAFKAQGYYQNYRGERLYPQDFKGVFVAGNAAPLSWDFANLGRRPELQLSDPDGDGIYEITLTLNAPEAARTTARRWQASLPVADLPQYESGFPLSDALYNLALEEARRAVEPDSTFRTGKEWAGVWTRDVSYSIILAQAALQPRVAQTSLLRKVTAQGRIVQDTGTGGAYPCSTDRVVWAVAAWEVYLATGDEAWLRRVYPIVRNTLEDDQQNALDPATGLMRGESSFLDWREQTYPRWMQPADIYQSQCLGTNAVHYQAHRVLAQMARALSEPAVAARHEAAAASLKAAVNQYLWLEKAGYYGQFRYGRLYPVVSGRSEGLGEALSVLFGVAEGARAARVLARTPVTPFGLSCVWPQTPGIAPYHNDAVWPFVQSFWGLAAAEAGDEAGLAESLAAVYRPAALFLTNKENFVAGNGDFAGTEINSSNMLWSLSGSLALVYKGLFGLRYAPDGLRFRPCVPAAWAGRRTLRNFRYRGAVLTIELSGAGTEVASLTLDGRPLPGGLLPAGLTGAHLVRIALKGSAKPAATPNRVANAFAPETPQVSLADGHLRWAAVPGAVAYRVLRNGELVYQLAPPATAPSLSFRLPPAAACVEYQVVAVDGVSSGRESFASEPLVVGGPAPLLVQLETLAAPAAYSYQGYTGAGFVEISTDKNTDLALPLDVPAAGDYALDFRYANGNGPVNTENKCALRTLRDAAGRLVGPVVLPQRGAGEWSSWGYSNALRLRLPAGRTELRLRLEPASQNMNGAVNQAMLDHLRLRRLG